MHDSISFKPTWIPRGVAEGAIEIHESACGQYWQELVDRNSTLHAFRPTVVLFAPDAHHLTAGLPLGSGSFTRL
jgi:hypothetical protein